MATEATTLAERVIDALGYAGAALDHAQRQQEAADAQQKLAEALIAPAVEALISGERIRPEDREKAAQILRDPVQTLELLTKVATRRNADERSLGQRTNEKTAQTLPAAQRPIPGFVGSRAAYDAFSRKVGLPLSE